MINRIYYIKINGKQLHNFEWDTYDEAFEFAVIHRIEAELEDTPIEIHQACIKYDGDERFYGCEGRVAIL